jgi:coenzyme F420-reducing hydrogenase gamma subunit
MRRLRVAVWKLASCDGCQLTLLDCEDELLAITDAVELMQFLEASSRVEPGPYDLSIVEGSVTTPEDVERIRAIRASSKLLFTIGACATAGGIQALRNLRDHRELMRLVYARPDHIATLATSTPISAHVPVDAELRGCPIDKGQLLTLLAATAAGRRPRFRLHATCVECKRRGAVCVMVAHGTPCLGPITQTGCGALCPGFERGCYGCFGPSDAARADVLLGALRGQGVADRSIARLLSTFNVAAPAFREAARRIGDD